MDVTVAAVASVVAGGVAFCFAFILFGSHKVPLYLGYAVIMGGVGAVCFVMGPTDRGSRMVAGGIGLLCLIGSAGLFAARADIVIHPHRHKAVTQAVVLDRSSDKLAPQGGGRDR